MRIDREYFIRFAVAVALACYDLPTDRAMTSEEAAQLVKWVIDMALGPDASNVQVEPMENYPASSKMPLIISMAGVQQHLFWFYPQQSFEEMCDALSAMLGEIPTATSHSLSRNRTNNWKEVSSHDRNNLFRPEEWHDVQPSQTEPRQRSPRACC